MSRIVTVGAAQLGPISRQETRRDAVGRMIALLEEAHRRGCGLVVFPEAALTAFFPHWYMEDPAEIDSYFERAMPGPETQPLFDRARKLGIGFCLGYCELAEEGGRKRRFNTSILVDGEGRLVGKYRKVHLPGHADHRPGQPYQNLEKRYFEVGNLGFPVWRAFGGVMGMMICNDRRWPEAYRVMGLQGAEMILLGYNTPDQSPQGRMEPPHIAMFHHLLSVQAGAYQNACWVVATAKAGTEEGIYQIGGTVIVAPTGEIAARALGDGDELIVAACDLDMGNWLKETTFAFARHRRPEHYGLIVERTGAEPPKR
jgi:N-carbamoyl-D-amino-acid hydrolase